MNGWPCFTSSMPPVSGDARSQQSVGCVSARRNHACKFSFPAHMRKPASLLPRQVPLLLAKVASSFVPTLSFISHCLELASPFHAAPFAPTCPGIKKITFKIHTLARTIGNFTLSGMLGMKLTKGKYFCLIR